MPVVRTPYRKRSSADGSRSRTSSHAVASFMGNSSVPRPDLVDAFILAHSFDIKIITACFSIAHVVVVVAVRRGIRLCNEDQLISNRNQSIAHSILSHCRCHSLIVPE